MIEDNYKKIIDSILGQIGGPLSYKDIGIIYRGNKDFYKLWDNFKERSLGNLDNLSLEEKKFLLFVTYWIDKKLDWEAWTVTGYEDFERHEAIDKLEKELAIKIDFKDIVPELPSELRSS